VGLASIRHASLRTLSTHAGSLDQTPGDNIVDGGDSKNIVLAIENLK